MYCPLCLHPFVCVIKVSVPVSEVVGVEEGRVEILPQKAVEDRDKDFTGGSSFQGAKRSHSARPKHDISGVLHCGCNSQRGCVLASTSSFLCEAASEWEIPWVTMETGPDPVQLPQSSPSRPVDKKPQDCCQKPR